MFKKTIFFLLLLPGVSLLLAQSIADSAKTRVLEEVMITNRKSTIDQMPPVQNGYLWSGKKSEVISLQNADVNIAERNPRQIFAKIPGVFVYDMDGAGNQMNISTRGLDPHRGWEFNVRANGAITNSDMYGYPASHFSAPMEAVDHIELVRGTGALQYGAQFGGMLNYALRQPDTTRRIGFETVNSIGSFGMFSTFNSIGGKVGRLQYYAYYNKRVSNNYRDENRTNFGAEGMVLNYRASNNLRLNASLLRSYYTIQLPGPLTDAMFQNNPRQAIRARNYYRPDIYVPSLSADWQIAPHTHLFWTVSAVLGTRSSVLFDRAATISDTIVTATRQYNNRQVDVDEFNSYTSELRFLQQYDLLGQSSALSAGVQYMNNDLHRQQLGIGTNASDYDLTITAAGFRRDLHLKTQNVAVFVENKFQLLRNLSINPGVRFESGASDMSGVITAYPYELENIPNTIQHRFPLFGVNAEFNINLEQNIYGGFSQAYRPVIFKDIIPGNALELVDKNLKDAYGYNAEIGYRGHTGQLRWDLSGFLLQYNNRLGNLALEEDGQVLTYKTNIGNSLTQGIEAFLEYGFYATNNLRFNLFSSTSYMNAVYQEARVKVGNNNQSVQGNKVEAVPEWISRNGLTIKYKQLSASFLYSYTAASYADALNTVAPSASGSVGLAPAYGLLDFNLRWLVAPNVVLRLNVNNIADKQYFTKRPNFYPGPGIWPSDGRSMNVSVAVRI